MQWLSVHVLARCEVLKRKKDQKKEEEKIFILKKKKTPKKNPKKKSPKKKGKGVRKVSVFQNRMTTNSNKRRMTNKEFYLDECTDVFHHVSALIFLTVYFFDNILLRT